MSSFSRKTDSAPAPFAAQNTSLRTLLHQAPPLILTCMVLSVVGMNLLANKSIDLGLTWLALDCGTLLSWVCFLSMDVLCRCYGARATTQLSLVALGLNLCVAAVFFLASVIPGTWSAEGMFSVVGGAGVSGGVGGGTGGVGGGAGSGAGAPALIGGALDATFRGSWFVILGSSVAFMVSATVNNYLNAWIGTHLRRDRGFSTFAARSFVSTFVGQMVDNLVFTLLVSRAFFGWTLTQCFMCALATAAAELLFEVAFSPLGYRLSQRILTERGGTSVARTNAAQVYTDSTTETEVS